ncbi:MAG: hypothetical protein H7Y09_04180 [Chitinophagaceae bacterium]|nr:hypothetical protein [Anaerolineae bacterium]
MVEITLKGEVAERLKEVASRKNMTPEAWVQEKLNEAQSSPSAISGEEGDTIGLLPNPLLQMAQIAREANLVFSENNVVERSREILETEFADYLIQRMQDNGDESE